MGGYRSDGNVTRKWVGGMTRRCWSQNASADSAKIEFVILGLLVDPSFHVRDQIAKPK